MKGTTSLSSCFNGCDKKQGCRKFKHYYRANDAHAEYKETLSDSRTGIDNTVEGIRNLDEFLSPLITQKQSFEHIVATHPERTLPSVATLYSYTNEGLFSFSNLDLIAKVRYRPRRKVIKKESLNLLN